MKQPESNWKEVVPYLSIGWQLALSLVIFVAAGIWLDRRLDSSPWFTLGGALLGVAAFFAQLYKLVVTLDSRDKQIRTKRNTGEPRK